MEVDPETGRTQVVKYTVVDDFGYLINPMLVEGQVHGGVAQGIGQAVTEEVAFSAEGQLLSGSFMDYALPRADDVPFMAFHDRAGALDGQSDRDEGLRRGGDGRGAGGGDQRGARRGLGGGGAARGHAADAVAGLGLAAGGARGGGGIAAAARGEERRFRGAHLKTGRVLIFAMERLDL